MLLFVDRQADDRRPDLHELDAFRQGKLPKKRAEQIKAWLVKDPELYQQWYQLRLEAKTIPKPKKVSWLASFFNKLGEAPLLSPALASLFVVAILVGLMGRQDNINDMLQLAQDDLQSWQQRTDANPAFKGGMARSWKQQGVTSDNMKWYQGGLNQYLKRAIAIDKGSIPECASTDLQCQTSKDYFTLLGAWVSKANVICQQATIDDQQMINQRLMDWGNSGLISQEGDLNLAFKQWQANHYEQVEPCQKVKHLVSIGVNA